MDINPIITGLSGLGVAILLLIVGVPVALALTIVGFAGVILITGNVSAGLTLLKTTPYTTVASISYTVMPLFIIMGYFTLHGGISEPAFRSAYKWLHRLPGSLLQAVTWACVGFGAVSGSSIAAATIFIKIGYPEMIKVGYDKKFTIGGISSAATIAMLIPPSLFFVIYAMLADQSISACLLSGVLPGLLLALNISIIIVIQVLRFPILAPKSKIAISWKEKIASLPGLWPIVVLILIIIGTIYGGICTANEAAAIAAAVALVLALYRKGLSWLKLITSLLDTASVTCMIFFILIGSDIFARFLTISGFSATVSTALIEMNLSPLGLVIGVMVLYLIMGCFIDWVPGLAITMPILLGPLKELGVNLIWFGAVACLAMQIGTLTPPFGIVTFAAKAAVGDDLTLDEVFKGCLPYCVMMLASLAILIAFPDISLILPNTMLVGK